MRHRRMIGWAVVGALAAGGCTILEDDPDPPVLACQRPRVPDVAAAIADAEAWLARAEQPDGRFWYEYDRAADEFSDDYHEVRHAAAAMALYQSAAVAGRIEGFETAEFGLRHILDGLVVDGDRTAFVGTASVADLGATALALAALVHRRIATGDEQYDDLMRSFARFMDSLRRDDGGMWARANAITLEPAIGQTSTFYTGEAFWAYGLLANQFPGEGWEEAARAVGRYIVEDRDAEEGIENPPHTDQWAAYGFAEMREWRPLDGVERSYIRRLSDKYHGRLERELQREALRVGDGSEAPDESVEQSRGAAFGTTVEALGSLWRLADVDPGLGDLEPALRADLICGAAVLVARQNSPVEAAAFARPDVVEGAWYDEDVTRVDDQQHAMAGLILALDAVAP